MPIEMCGKTYYILLYCCPAHSQVLVIAPQNIDDDVLLLIADSKIRHLHLFQNRYTPKSIMISPCSSKAWRTVKRDNPTLKVHLCLETTDMGDVLLQPDAPVASVLYRSPKIQVRCHRIA